MGSVIVFLGIGRLIPLVCWFAGDWDGFICRALRGIEDREPQPGTGGWCWLFCDRDRVRHRIVVKLSFAHAEGRNYRQLPDRARLREEPSPADIVCFKRYSFFELDVSGSMSFLGTGVQSRGLLL